MTITLPLHTVSEANLREHWAKRAKRVRGQRATVCMALRANMALGKQQWNVKHGGGVLVTLTRIAPKLLDSDNAVGAMKACRDGVADALGVKDNHAALRWSYKQRQGRVREYAVQIDIGAFGELELATEWENILP